MYIKIKKYLMYYCFVWPKNMIVHVIKNLNDCMNVQSKVYFEETVETAKEICESCSEMERSLNYNVD